MNKTFLVFAVAMSLGGFNAAKATILAASPNIDLSASSSSNVAFPNGSTLTDMQSLLNAQPTGTTNFSGTGFSVAINTAADEGIVQGNLVNKYSAPFDSSTTQVTSKYLSTGTGAITFTFTDPQKFFGVLWGSVDASNQLEFFSNGVSVGKVLGSDVTATPNGAQTAFNSFYVAINLVGPGVTFDKVVESSNVISFESVNLFADTANSVPTPEPATFGLLGSGLIGCAVLSRRKRAR